MRLPQFSLRTIFVVVTLISIPIGLVGFFIASNRHDPMNGSLGKAYATVDSMSQGCWLFKEDVGTYPSTLDELRFAPSIAGWEGPYYDRPVPLDPWGNPYQYQFPGSRHPGKPDIWSWGPDMHNGTDDDVYNRWTK